jgi:hypothetical protein
MSDLCTHASSMPTAQAGHPVRARLRFFLYALTAGITSCMRIRIPLARQFSEIQHPQNPSCPYYDH